MSFGEVALLVVAGIGAGLIGSIAGLASLVSYPAMLAIGLGPTAANITNSVALVGSTIGSISGSRPELSDQWPRALRLASAGLVGGVVGGLLLLVTPDGSFERLVPWLIALASVAVLIRRRLTEAAVHDRTDAPSGRVLLIVGLVGVYGGYFGAGAGVMLLALFLHVTRDSVARCNALKSVVLGSANGVAALMFAIVGDVDWPAALALGVGALIGGRIGPTVVRRAPVGPLRMVIGLAGLGLAVALGVDAYW